MVMFKKSKLESAVKSGNLAAARELIELGTELTFTDEYGYTMLHYAVSRGHIQMAQLLIEKGADAEQKLSSEGTLLHVAAQRGSVEVAKLLLEKAPQLLMALDYRGNTPLHAAAEAGQADFAVFLIGLGADVNTRNFDSRTPLFLAQKQEHRDTEALLKPLTRSAVVMPQEAAPVAAALTVAALAPEWKKLPGERIARVAVEEAIGYRITEIFNFAAREKTTLYQNLSTKSETVETRGFDAMGDNAALEEALKELQKQGGTSDAASINSLDKKKLSP